MLGLALSAVLAATTPAEAVAQIKAAQPGDVVQLSGAFGALALLNIVKAGQVTIDAAAATFSSVTIAGSSNLTLQGGRYNPTDWHGCVYVTGSTTIRLRGLDCVGSDTNIPGVTFRGASDAALEDSRVSRVGIGVSITQSSNVGVRGSSLFGQVVDDIDVGSSSDVVIEDNSFSGSAALPGMHPDATQVLNPSTQGGAIVRSLTFRRNFIFGATQGVNAFAGGLQGCLIEDNAIRTSFPQGIALTQVTSCTERNNRASTLPGSTYQTTINIKDSPDTISCGDVVAPYKTWPGRTGPAC